MSDDVIERYEYLKNHPGRAEFHPFIFQGKPTSIRTLAGGFLIFVGLALLIAGIVEKIKQTKTKETELQVPKIETEEIPPEKKIWGRYTEYYLWLLKRCA